MIDFCKIDRRRSCLGKGLLCALNGLALHHDVEYNEFYLPKDFYHPGYLVALTAYLHHHRIEQRNFNCHADNTGYFAAMAMSKALWNSDTYDQQRVNEGRSYSVITPLHNEEAVDIATTTINSCIRTFTQGKHHTGITDLFHVVGELHDNVWSHGLSSGFSMAQRSKVPLTDDYYLEFALADHGLGFLAETNRTGKDHKSHEEAIKWCIVEGNSTKHSDDMDEWAQYQPSDILGGSPFGGQIETRSESNHHQGLGLAHLVKLVKKYNGELTLASGDACYMIDSSGQESFQNLQFFWQGVSISCKFRESSLCQDFQEEDFESDELLSSIIEQLGG